MVLAWKEWDLSTAAVELSEKPYFDLVEKTFGSDLAVISYLRNRLSEDGGTRLPTFGELLFPALYLDPEGQGFVTPDPLQTHRHLDALFQHHPGRVWTTNYDDLIEAAASEAGVRSRTLDPTRRAESRAFSVAHLHGFLAPEGRREGHPEPRDAPIVLAEDDYHAVAGDVVGWTNREFVRLFDGYHGLILGMSLGDPNLRRILSVTAAQSERSRRATGPAHPQHFAVMRSLSAIDLGELPESRSSDIDEARAWRAWYWRQHGVELIEVPIHDSILPFLMRLRYESYGDQPGSLWHEAARLCQHLDPWQELKQGFARDRLTDIINNIRNDFGVDDPGEIVEVGVFLMKPDGRTLELAFRGGASVRAQRGRREFSADPDHPTGIAGRVFVSSDLVRVSRKDALYDFGVGDTDRGRPSSTTFQGIISVPIIDWQRNGVPLGVIYVTTSTTTGTLFSLPPKLTPGATGRTLDDLYLWLQKWGLELLTAMV